MEEAHCRGEKRQWASSILSKRINCGIATADTTKTRLHAKIVAVKKSNKIIIDLELTPDDILVMQPYKDN